MEILLSSIKVKGKHGVYPREKRKVQNFEVDVRILMDGSKAVASDDLAYTVDYGSVARIVKKVVGEESYNLIESLADRLAREIGTIEKVKAVEVKVRKMRPSAAYRVDFAQANCTYGKWGESG
ncbi:MAG: dihydroneopterin aldolase [Actinobacteria bacterium]|nr:dihydroneopterin aldolase [Actinomycetota bacterium]